MFAKPSSTVRDPYLFAFFGLLILLTLFRLVYITQNEVHPDEAYYWGLGDRLDWSYYDHPPLTAYAIGLSTSFFGKTEFAVRLPAVIFAAASLLILFFFALDIFNSNRTAFLTVFLFSLIPASNINAIIITPDAPQFFFWCLTAWLYLRACRTDAWIYWLSGGVTLGLGLLSKYTVVFFVPALFLFLLIFPQQRQKLWGLKLYSSLFLAFCLFLPVVYWNFVHDFISFKFQFHHGMDGSKKPAIATFIEFLGGQAGLISPIFFFLIIDAAFRKQNYEDENLRESLVYLAIIFAFSLFFFAFQSLRSKVEANWPGYCYATAFLLLGYLVDRRWFAEKCRGLILTGALLASGMSAVILVHGVYRFLPLPVKKDVTYKLIGWRKLGEKIQVLQRKHGFKFIIAEGPTLCSLIRFYTPFTEVFEVNARGHYFKWNRSLPDGGDALFITTNREKKRLFSPHFKKPFEEECLKTAYNKAVFRTFYFFIGKSKNGSGRVVKTFPQYY
ncbi:glycosyltransferase family 39 protein [Candidatus Riflebacteria bacterium]